VRPASPAPAVADPVLVEADMEPLLRDYLASRRALIAEMAGSLAAGRRDELRQAAHKLAGSFALYGFRWASEQCRWIESNHAQVAAERVHALAGELQAHLDTVEIRFIPPDLLPQ
jgi:two-component system response regulator BaeR